MLKLYPPPLHTSHPALDRTLICIIPEQVLFWILNISPPSQALSIYSLPFKLLIRLDFYKKKKNWGSSHQFWIPLFSQLLAIFCYFFNLLLKQFSLFNFLSFLMFFCGSYFESVLLYFPLFCFITFPTPFFVRTCTCTCTCVPLIFVKIIVYCSFWEKRKQTSCCSDEVLFVIISFPEHSFCEH